MKKAFKDIAQRIINAENTFIENVMNATKCTRDEAEKVLSVYRKAKVVKQDAVLGTIKVKHGVYWEADVLRNAINIQQ